MSRLIPLVASRVLLTAITTWVLASCGVFEFEEQWDAISIASRSCDVEQVREIVESGRDPSDLDSYSFPATPLAHALGAYSRSAQNIDGACEETVEFLMNRGVDPAKMDDENSGALYFVVSGTNSPNILDTLGTRPENWCNVPSYEPLSLLELARSNELWTAEDIEAYILSEC